MAKNRRKTRRKGNLSAREEKVVKALKKQGYDKVSAIKIAKAQSKKKKKKKKK